MYCRSESIEEIDASKKALKPVLESDYLVKYEIKNWKKRWYKCIASDRDYFEVDEIDLDE